MQQRPTTPPYGPGNPRRSTRPRKVPERLCIRIRRRR
jgi:hypothetical protein